MHRTVVPIVLALVLPATAAADLRLQGFAATVVEQDVTYAAEVCSSTSVNSTSWGVFHDRSTAPKVGDTPDQTKAVSGLVCNARDPKPKSLVWTGAPIGLYHSFAVVDPAGSIPETNEANNVAGPIDVCVGPDLILERFEITSTGAAVAYEATICNRGSMAAHKFRVGVWHDRPDSPPADQMGNIFAAVTVLAPDTCEDLIIAGGLRPNGSFTAWSRADSGDFVLECREGNNPVGPLPYSLSNPDLVIKSVETRVDGGAVIYDARVCNEGTASVTKFFVDVSYHRFDKVPTIGDPGDQAKPVQNLAAGACTDVSFSRASTPDGDYQSWVQVDADDFISEPNEGNNLEGPIFVRVGKGGTPDGGGEDCQDGDGDGFAVGDGCTGVPDCDDADAEIKPDAKEVCGDQIDQDCDLTPNDGCPGVDCIDADGDGFGVGSDCVLADCDDNNKAVYPWAPEVCGDNKDDNCNGIADDGCTGRQCVDRDADGFGVGQGCPGPQDCDDRRFDVRPGAKETCGDGRDDDCDTVADDGCTTPIDGDGDGNPVGGGGGQQPDCNDADAKVGPDAKEVCGDNVDNDCDGTVDDGCPGVDCVDGDGDGWGVGAACVVADCDDTDKDRHPWAPEVCGDGVDNDCDGTVDDGCAGVDCVDGDGDGWGVGAGCARSDCNDDDGGMHPWMAELCADGKDNNCDGSIDEGCLVCEDKDGDGAGIGPKCQRWDCDDENKSVFAGAEEICDGKDNNCDETIPDGEDKCSEGGDGCACRLDGAADVARSAAVPLLLMGLWLFVRRRRPR